MKRQADAVLAASIFHFGTCTVGDVKQFLAKKKNPVRLWTAVRNSFKC
jgi:imidazole glycerol phosphate synthase subunit HisF